MMKYLIVGLGNPGEEYKNTRHNIGFTLLDALADASNSVFNDNRYGATADYSYRGRSFTLLKPSTFMNLSGKAVNYWLKKENVPFENLLVVVDDLALPFGTLRLRAKGSDAGHNGLKDIQAVTGRSDYARLRFGIGNDFPRGRQVDYVLGKWNEAELAEINLKAVTCIQIIQSFGTMGIAQAMNQFNKHK